MDQASTSSGWTDQRVRTGSLKPLLTIVGRLLGPTSVGPHKRRGRGEPRLVCGDRQCGHHAGVAGEDVPGGATCRSHRADGIFGTHKADFWNPTGFTPFAIFS